MNVLRWILSLGAAFVFSLMSAAQEKGPPPLPKDCATLSLIALKAAETCVTFLETGSGAGRSFATC